MLKSITEQNKECNAGLYEDAKRTHCKDWGVISASMQYDKVIMTQKNYWTPGQTRVYFYTV